MICLNISVTKTSAFPTRSFKTSVTLSSIRPGIKTVEIEIIRYYYGDNMFINIATEVSWVSPYWMGQDLTIGSSGDKVRIM